MRDRISRSYSNLNSAFASSNPTLMRWLFLALCTLLPVLQPSALHAAEYDPNSLPLDDPNAVVRTVIEALEELQFPFSGRGTAIWKHKGRFRRHEGKDLTVEFAFKGQSSLMDVFEPASGAKRISTRLYANIMSDKSYIAVNPENAQIDRADPFRRRITQDFHPNAIMKFHHSSLSEMTAVFLEPGFNLSVSLDAEGILHIRGQNNLDEPGPGTESEDYQKGEFAFDTRAGLLPVLLATMRKSPDRESQVTIRYRWAVYGAVPYVTSIICHGKGEREIYDEFTITSFKPNVEIPDEQFTLKGLDIPDGLPVYDKLTGTEYRHRLDSPPGGENDSSDVQSQQVAQIEPVMSVTPPSSLNSPDVESSDPTAGSKSDARGFRRWPFACAAVVLIALGVLLARVRARRRRDS